MLTQHIQKDLSQEHLNFFTSSHTNLGSSFKQKSARKPGHLPQTVVSEMASHRRSQLPSEMNNELNAFIGFNNTVLSRQVHEFKNKCSSYGDFKNPFQINLNSFAFASGTHASRARKLSHTQNLIKQTNVLTDSRNKYEFRGNGGTTTKVPTKGSVFNQRDFKDKGLQVGGKDMLSSQKSLTRYTQGRKAPQTAK